MGFGKLIYRGQIVNTRNVQPLSKQVMSTKYVSFVMKPSAPSGGTASAYKENEEEWRFSDKIEALKASLDDTGIPGAGEYGWIFYIFERNYSPADALRTRSSLKQLVNTYISATTCKYLLYGSNYSSSWYLFKPSFTILYITTALYGIRL